MRQTRSMARNKIYEKTSNFEFGEEKKIIKKRHTKSMEKDFLASEQTSPDEYKTNSPSGSTNRAIFLMNKRIPI